MTLPPAAPPAAAAPPPTRWALIAGSVGFGVLGVLLGAVLAFWQAARVSVGPVTVPWGAVIAVVVLVAVIRIAVNALASRWAGAAVFTGWLVATVGLATQTPWAGDLIISSGARQLGYLLVGVVAGSAAASVRSR